MPDDVLDEQTTEDPTTGGQTEDPTTEDSSTGDQTGDQTGDPTTPSDPDSSNTDPTDPTNPTNNGSNSAPINILDVLNITSIPVNIPIDFLFVYNRLLLLMVELGESMIHTCKALCDSKNMPIVECYHMFKAALAARQLSLSSGTSVADSSYYAKVANTLLNYVKAQLNCIAENYQDSISFTLPYDANGTINLFITINNNTTEVIVDPSDNSAIEDLINNLNNTQILQGIVVTPDSDETYGLTEDELATYSYWHVLPGSEFVPGTSVVHINGVLYILDENDYEEWIVTENGVSIAVGIKLLTGSFDVGNNPDEIYIKGTLVSSDESDEESEDNTTSEDTSNPNDSH